MTLYVCDLDDTLIENGKKLKKETIEKLNKIFGSSDKELIIASARNYNGIKERIKGLKKNIKIIARNGTVAFDENENVIYSKGIEKDNLKKAIKYSLENNLCPIVIDLVGKEEILYASKKYLNDEFIKYTKNLKINYMDNIENMEYTNVIGIYSFGSINKDKYYNISGLKIWKDREFLHITNENANKVYALKELLKKNSYENIICFGNDENDYLMLDYGNSSYFICNNEVNKNNKYNNLPFDNGASILKIMDGDI